MNREIEEMIEEQGGIVVVEEEKIGEGGGKPEE